MNAEELRKVYYDQFLDEPMITVSSPGRINLIGEHTDYNNGFVLPAAINKSIRMSFGRRQDNNIHLYSIDNQELFASSINEIQRSPSLWPDYILGVADELLKKGLLLGGFNAVVTGDVPLGAGLSSSAALECATVFALNELFELQLDKITMVKLAQRAENNFVGVQCGIMDQFASMMGKVGHVIKLDCRSLEFEYFPLKMDGYKVVLLDSQVKHSLASSEYNTRRNECAKGVHSISQKYPWVKSLRDADLAMVEENISDPVIRNRCTYVVEETKRLLDGCTDLKRGNVAAFGKKMYQTHEGLSKLYEVSCKELDFLVGECSKEKNILGARMMGGGFGGCAIALIKSELVDKITTRISEAYHQQIGKRVKVYITQTDSGTSILL